MNMKTKTGMTFIQYSEHTAHMKRQKRCKQGRDSMKKRSPKFRRDPEKQYRRCFRLYPSFLCKYLDRWLKRMSLSGWHIVHCGLVFFWFEKGEPAEKEYFTYCDMTGNDGAYSLCLRHPFLEETYGVKPQKSKINRNERKTRNIVEIDLNRIDIQNDVGYRELVDDRNRLHLKYFFMWVSLLVFLLGLLLVLKLIF